MEESEWNYITEKLIARGTYADLHQVLTTKNVRCVAKKIRLPLQLGDAEQEIQDRLDKTFRSEKRLCVLNHENVVKFYDMAILNKESAVVVFMELLDGHTLEKFVGGKPLPEDTIRLLSTQICSAMNYLHTLAKPVLHRNINPRTVMVTDDQKIKLIDFGLAIHLVDSATLHVSTDPKGDPCFMAPELFLCDETDMTPYSRASDVWAFGCTVYHMATGLRPHADCKNMLAIVRRVHREGAPPLTGPPSSELLLDFYGHCTNPDKALRPTASELLKHRFLHGALLPSVMETQVPEQDALQTKQVSSSDEYSPNSADKGVCLVISVAKYSDASRFPERLEQPAEVQAIRQTFEGLKFKVEVHADPTGADMWRVLHGTASSLGNSGIFICFIVAHGVSSRVCASDGEEVELRDVVARFRFNQCPELKGRPKLFFMQTTKREDCKGIVSSDESAFYLRESDFLLCGATVAASSSYVKTLCGVVDDATFGFDHVENIVNEVNRRLGIPSLKQASEAFSGTNAVSTLKKKLFLNRKRDQEILPENPDTWTEDQLALACNDQSDANQVFGPKEQTLLMIAAIRGKDDLISELLKAPSQTPVSAQDVMGRTAISWAAVMGHSNVLAAFEKVFEADPEETLKKEVNRGDNMQQTPIILAAKEHKTSVLVQLVKMKADLNAQDLLKYTALTHAARLGFEDTVSELLRLGADPKLLDFSGNSPLIWAARFGHAGVISILKDCVTDVEYWRLAGERSMNAQEWAKFCERFECAVAIQDIIQGLVQQTSQGTDVTLGNSGGPDDTSGSPGGGSASGGSDSGSSGSNLRDSRGSGRDPGGQESDSYSMHYRQNSVGLALVVNIVDFRPGSELPRRDGAMEDMQERNRLYQAFCALGFECRLFQNVNGRFFDNFPTNVCTEEELQDCQVILVCLMSHGEQDYIFAHDNAKINLEEKIFSAVRCRPELKGKPKIFIVQACRDIPQDRCVSRRLGQFNAGKHEDSLYFYSVIRGDKSLRNPNNGGLFTQELSDVILNQFDQRNKDFPTVMWKVIERVRTRSERQQVPCSNSTMMKPLRFPCVGFNSQNP